MSTWHERNHRSRGLPTTWGRNLWWAVHRQLPASGTSQKPSSIKRWCELSSGLPGFGNCQDRRVFSSCVSGIIPWTRSNCSRLRRLHLVIVDLCHPRKTVTRTEKQFYQQITRLRDARGVSVTPIPLCNQEEWRCRYVFGYSLDDSDKPVFLIWPERTGKQWFLAPRCCQEPVPQPLSGY